MSADSPESREYSSLTAVTIDLLYDGMEVEEDIYDFTAATMIVGRGAALTYDLIEKIRTLNKYREVIYVTGKTYRSLIEKSPPPMPYVREELEENTGYASTKDETHGMLDEVSRSQAVEQGKTHTISSNLSSQLEVLCPSTVMALINALAPVDEYLQRHCINVSLLNGLFGRWLGLPKSEIDKLVLMGLVHDCGKALIPPHILNAPRKLTLTEFEVVKMHAVFSYELLYKFPEPVRLASRLHHEKICGAGYPDRLSRDSIPLEARITAVSDIYDAMVSQRAYKKANSPFHTMAMLEGLKGKDLDARLVNVFNQRMPFELLNKLVMMSDGSVGVVRAFDPKDIEFPIIEVDGRALKSGANWRCVSMYSM